MKFKMAQFAALLLLTLITGVFWGTWFTLTRSIENFSPEYDKTVDARHHSSRLGDYPRTLERFSYHKNIYITGKLCLFISTCVIWQ